MTLAFALGNESIRVVNIFHAGAGALPKGIYARGKGRRHRILFTLEVLKKILPRAFVSDEYNKKKKGKLPLLWKKLQNYHPS